MLFLRGCCQHDNVGFVRLDRCRASAGRWLVGCSALLALAAAPSAPAGASPETPPPDLTLVTLTGPGTAASGHHRDVSDLLARQDALLASIGEPEPVYRWTAALNGFAAELTPDQRAALEADPQVSLVEPNEVRPLASLSGASVERMLARPTRMRGGAGVVIGVVDTGIAAESPVFAAVPGLGRDARTFRGTCRLGEGWSPETCNRKLVGAHWFVDGFGSDRIRSTEVISARDTLGHGTQVASVAAGNARVSVRVDGRDAGQFGGVAPQARIAAYKACWAAPDPADDGCAAADVVSAVDQAVRDGVDVLNLAIAGGSGIDTVQRALLGAAEADIVAVAAAGNNGGDAYAAHPAPWVSTVGSTVGKLARGTLEIDGGPSLVGGGRLDDVSGQLVRAVDARAQGASMREARQCRPGALDARKVSGRVVVCERGGLARVAKSEAVDRADGVGMVLLNVRPGGVSADLHDVPTVHLALRDARTLRRWLRRHDTTRVRLLRAPGSSDVRRAAPWSAVGDPRGPALKPDLVAPAESVLGATPDSADHSWGVFSGSSAAAAHVAGAAAVLRSRHDWPASVVRSVLSSSARPVRSRSVFDRGAGRLSSRPGSSHLALEVPPKAWRRALDSGRWDRLNVASLLMPGGRGSATRTLTNVGSRAEYFSVSTRGFSSHRVSVRPLALRLAPGESATFRVSVSRNRPGVGLDDGEITWLGARGGTTRIPVALTR